MKIIALLAFIAFVVVGAIVENDVTIGWNESFYE